MRVSRTSSRFKALEVGVDHEKHQNLGSGVSGIYILLCVVYI